MILFYGTALAFKRFCRERYLMPNQARHVTNVDQIMGYRDEATLVVSATQMVDPILVDTAKQRGIEVEYDS